MLEEIKRFIWARTPRSVCDMYNKIKYSLFYFLYRKRYKYHVIYVANCPKVASTWITHLLAQTLPGFKPYYPKTHPIGQIGNNYDVTNTDIEDLKNKLVTLRSHTPPKKENIENLNKHVGRYIILVRDIRDVIVSAYYHIKTNPTSAFVDYGKGRDLPWKPVPKEALNMGKEELLDLLIDQVFPSLVDFVYGWVKYAHEHDNVLLVHFERITKNTFEDVKRIMDFYEMKINDDQIHKAVEKTAFKPNIKKKEKQMFNMREGKKGGWKEELTPAQIERCNNIAGEYIDYLASLPEGIVY